MTIEQLLRDAGVKLPDFATRDQISDLISDQYWQIDQELLKRLAADLDVSIALAAIVTGHVQLACTYLDAVGGHAAVLEYLDHVKAKYQPSPGPNPTNKWNPKPG